MQFTTSITKTGQVTIPTIILNYLGIQPNTKIVFELKNNEVIIKPITDFFSMKGSVQSKRLFNLAAMEKAVTEAIKTSYGKKSH